MWNKRESLGAFQKRAGRGLGRRWGDNETVRQGDEGAGTRVSGSERAGGSGRRWGDNETIRWGDRARELALVGVKGKREVPLGAIP